MGGGRLGRVLVKRGTWVQEHENIHGTRRFSKAMRVGNGIEAWFYLSHGMVFAVLIFARRSDLFGGSIVGTSNSENLYHRR